VVLMAIFKKITNSESVEPMNCKEVRLFIPLFVLGDQEMTLDEWFALDDHIQSCPRCAKEYKETRFIIESIEHQQTDLINKGIFSEPAEEDATRELTDEENLQEIWDRVERSEARRRHNRNVKQAKHFFKVSAAISACLIIGIFAWLVFSVHSKPNSTPKAVIQQVALAPKPSVKIELMSKDGNILIPANQQIIANDELKTLVINGKHRLMMNTNTVLAIEPLVKHSNIGCLVKLDSGQIYTHVEHDGNPFAVETVCGKAVITGTTFDIKATKDSMTLVVSEGTVRFESQKGIVNVAAGQKSEIAGQSAPSIPLSCNTDELTAWATGYKPNTALAQDKSNDIDLYLALSLRTDPIVLAETDYSYWVNEKRNWFKKDFPWIFELKDALAKERIEADYPELLIRSSDVWQFVCLQRFPGRFSVPDFESLLKTAVSYGFDEEWLLENVPIAKLIQDKSLLSENPTGLDALDQLLKYAKGTEAIPYYLYPADAGVYLTETRSLIWFAINAGQLNLTDEQLGKILDLLQQEVITATNCSNVLLYPEDEKKKPLCGDVCETPEMKMAGYIEMIKATEKKVMEYEISK